MSNFKAIAAITAALRNLLSDVDHGIPSVVGDVKVTTKPLDKTREGIKGNQLNIYLYQFLPNPAWRNMRDPKKGPMAMMGPPPVALDLYYLLTAYGEGDDEVKGHMLLGKAMDILNENPRFPVEELRVAVDGSDLYKDTGLISIVPQFLPLEELSKFWTSASTGFRASMVYKVSVILIDNERDIRTAIPGQGPRITVPSPSGLLPNITHLLFPGGVDRAQIGDEVVVEGSGFSGDGVTVVVEPPFGADPLVLQAEEATPSRVRFQIPDEPGFAGRYRLWLRVTTGELALETNALVFPLAAAIETDSLTVTREEGSREVRISLTCQPAIHPAQRVYLLVGAAVGMLETELESISDSLSFLLTDIDAGEYPLRLRVDGIDSRLLDFSATPPGFDPALMVTIP